MSDLVLPLAFATPELLSRLLWHAYADEVEQVAGIAARSGYGAVYTARSNAGKDRIDRLLATAARHIEVTSLATCLLDANRYAGKQRVNGLHEISLAWLRQQEALGLPYALTDSGFVEDGRIDQLRSVLEQAARHQKEIGIPVVAVVAIGTSWLEQDAQELRGEIERHGVRVALAVQHANDPFSKSAVVAGLLQVLGSGVPVWLLRTDLSAVGALAAGAEHASIGTTTSLRHVYPVGSRGGFAKSDWFSVLNRRIMAWKTHDRMIEGAATFPDSTIWDCTDCGHCAGRRIDHSIRTEADAIAHNSGVIAWIESDVLTSPDPMATWRSLCQSAQFRLLEIEGETDLDFGMPRYLAAWLKATAPVRQD